MLKNYFRDDSSVKRSRCVLDVNFYRYLLEWLKEKIHVCKELNRKLLGDQFHPSCLILKPTPFYQILVHTRSSTKLNFFLGEITVKEGRRGKGGKKKERKKKETRFPESIDQAP